MDGSNLYNVRDTMDDADVATRNAEQLEMLMKKKREREAAFVVPSALICEECGEEIPEGRRIAQPGCRFCVDCQEELDRPKGSSIFL